MEFSKRRRYLDRVVNVLKKYRVVSIDDVFEGCFEFGSVRPAELAFVVSRARDCVESLSEHIKLELKKENLSCNLSMAYCQYEEKGKKYKFRILCGPTMQPNEYGIQTERILQKIPKLIRDYKQKYS